MNIIKLFGQYFAVIVLKLRLEFVADRKFSIKYVKRIKLNAVRVLIKTKPSEKIDEILKNSKKIQKNETNFDFFFAFRMMMFFIRF